MRIRHKELPQIFAPHSRRLLAHTCKQGILSPLNHMTPAGWGVGLSSDELRPRPLRVAKSFATFVCALDGRVLGVCAVFGHSTGGG
jgi:hypothetical protein